MKSIMSSLLGVVIAIAGTLSGFKQARAQANPPRFPGIDFATIEFVAQKLAPNVYALTGSPGADPGHPEGAGGRMGLLVGPDGILLVDASYAPLTDKIVATIRSISAAPIRYLVNTHEHPDHTGGNPNFAGIGAVILGREEVWQALSQPPTPALVAAVGAAASFSDPRRLPAITYAMGSDVKIRMDGEVVDLIPAPASHTDGDTIVRFEHADVMMIGDFYRNYGYPFIDATHGGSFAGVLDALDLVMKLSGPNTQLVPGHGTIIMRSDIPPYRDMIVKIRAQIRKKLVDGKSLQDVLAAKLTAPYDGVVPGGIDPLPAGLGTSADRFVSEMYAELSIKGSRP